MDAPSFVSAEGAWVWAFSIALIAGVLILLAVFKRKRSYLQPYASAKRPGEPPEEVELDLRKKMKK
jgi:hypothetical protein